MAKKTGHHLIGAVSPRSGPSGKNRCVPERLNHLSSGKGQPLRRNPCLPLWGLSAYYAYFLRSLKDSGYYYGHSNNVDKRLKSHNGGKVQSTKHRRPFKLIYFETFASKKEAIQRELFFKSIDGYVWLKKQGII